MWQNFTSEQTQKASFDFFAGFVCLPLLRGERLRLHVHLDATRVYLQLLSALSHQTVLANSSTPVETGAAPWLGPGWYSPGVWQRAAVAPFSLLPAQVKCHVLSGKLRSHLRSEQCAECDVGWSRLPVLAWGIGP